MTAALVVYALAALTSASYQHALAEARGRARVGLFVIVLAAALWPLHLPALAIDWLSARRGSR